MCLEKKKGIAQSCFVFRWNCIIIIIILPSYYLWQCLTELRYKTAFWHNGNTIQSCLTLRLYKVACFLLTVGFKYSRKSWEKTVKPLLLLLTVGWNNINCWFVGSIVRSYMLISCLLANYSKKDKHISAIIILLYGNPLLGGIIYWRFPRRVLDTLFHRIKEKVAIAKRFDD